MPVCHPRRDPSALRRLGAYFPLVEWTGPDEDDKPASVITQSEKNRDELMCFLCRTAMNALLPTA